MDVRRWPYVCPFNWTIKTRVGNVQIVKGWLSDGASGPLIADLCPTAFFAHDKLYTRPYLSLDGRLVRVTKTQADFIYGWILVRHWRIVRGIERFVMLQIFGGKAWDGYRSREKIDHDFWMDHIVPKTGQWEFPSFRTADAKWIGEDVEMIKGHDEVS